MTFSSAELIDALRRRRRRSLRPERPAGEFPPGWAAWFDAMEVRVGAVTGAAADAILAVFIAREPKLPPRAMAELNHWQAFNTLWRQQWHPASEDDEPGIRIVASVVTLVVHLFLALFLLYVAYVRFMGVAEPASAGEDVVQVEYIGEGTPEDTGGGPPAGEMRVQETPEPAASAAAAPRSPQARAQSAPSPPPAAAEVAVEPAPSPPAQAPPVEQPLQVTETPEPDQAFTLPPVSIAPVPRPMMPVPDLSTPTPQVDMVELPTPVAAPALQPIETVPPRTPPPRLQQQPATVTMREIPAPLTPASVPNVPVRPGAAPDLRAEAPEVAVRAIPSPGREPPGEATQAQPGANAGAANASSPSSSPATASTSNGKPASGSEAASAGAGKAGTSTGSGATSSPKPGALPSTRRGDDWGVSTRNRPGGQAGTPGLFNADGTPKLASGGGNVGGGLPPGTITEDFEKIDRNGTWLKRPPIDYTPTAFDKFWVPNETLLQEWVRRSIKEVLIPIPGTSKSIKCSVVLLALGGACDITDPNMQDVEAGARKPPDVPFKPELQENQDALAPPPGTQ
jgi:hypothetical protein